MINITFCSQEWDDSALWLKAGSWKLWIWNPVTEVSVSLLYLLCSNPETCYAIILIKSANNFVTARKKNINLHHLIWSLLMKSSQWKLRAQQHSPVALYWLRYYALQDVFWLKSWSVTFQMKATKQYFLVVLVILLCKVAACLLSLWVKSQSVTIGMKAFVRHFPGVLCIALN